VWAGTKWFRYKEKTMSAHLTQHEKVNRLGSSNAGTITYPNGNQVLYSYATPVGVKYTDADGQVWYVVAADAHKVYSASTAAHIKRWISAVGAINVAYLPYTEVKDRAIYAAGEFGLDYGVDFSGRSTVTLDQAKRRIAAGKVAKRVSLGWMDNAGL
jgi:hypothetical protein